MRKAKLEGVAKNDTPFGICSRPRPPLVSSESVAMTWHYLCEQAGNPVIVIPTGGGKSIIPRRWRFDAWAGAKESLILAHRKVISWSRTRTRSGPDARLLGGSVLCWTATLRQRATLSVRGFQSVWKKSDTSPIAR